jgi:hypothetical protein
MLTPETYVNQPGGMLTVTEAPLGELHLGRPLKRILSEIHLNGVLKLVENIRHS